MNQAGSHTKHLDLLGYINQPSINESFCIMAWPFISYVNFPLYVLMRNNVLGVFWVSKEQQRHWTAFLSGCMLISSAFFSHSLDPPLYGSTCPPASNLHEFFLAAENDWPSLSVWWTPFSMRANLVDWGSVMFTITSRAASWEISLLIKTQVSGHIPWPKL